MPSPGVATFPGYLRAPAKLAITKVPFTPMALRWRNRSRECRTHFRTGGDVAERCAGRAGCRIHLNRAQRGHGALQRGTRPLGIWRIPISGRRELAQPQSPTANDPRPTPHPNSYFTAISVTT